MIKHPVKEEVTAKLVNPITQKMVHEGDDSGADPKFVGGGHPADPCKFVGLGESGIRDDAPKLGRIEEDAANKFVEGGDLGDAPSLKLGTVSPQLPPQSGRETVDGTDQQQVRKRKNREISEVGQPAEKEGMNKDARYRAKKKVAQQKVEKENNDLKAKNEELERVIMQLKWDKVGLEKQVLELKAEVKEAVAEKEKAEKRYIQKELDNTKQKLQTLTEELQLYEFPFDLPMDGPRTSGYPPKQARRGATWIERMATFLSNPSTKLPSLQGRKEFLNSISSSIMSLFKYATTKKDAKRRFAVGRDDWEKDFHRKETLCTLNSYLEPLREMGSNRVLKSFIREEIYCTLSSYYESQKGKYEKLMALARRIRASTILQSYAGNLDCDLIDFEDYPFYIGKYAFDMMKGILYELVLNSIRRYAESLRVEEKPSCIMQLSFASPTAMCSGILQSFYKPLRKGGVWNLYELRSFRRLLVVKRRLVFRIKKLRTLRSHFDPPNGRADLFILVKNSARSVWKFRSATQATRKPVIVGDLVDDQIVFYEGDLPTGAHYRSEIAIVALGLATLVELESFH